MWDNPPGGPIHVGVLLLLSSAGLLSGFRDAARGVIHARHDSVEGQSPLRPGQPGNDIEPEAAPVPGETVIATAVSSAIIGTDQQEQLNALGVTQGVLTDLTTEHPVSKTARMATNYGFRTMVVADAMTTFSKQGWKGERFDADTVHRVHLVSLKGEFAQICDTEEVLAMLL